MGIARRKAGTMVRCPACTAEVTVPADKKVVKERRAPVPQSKQAAAPAGSGPSPANAAPAPSPQHPEQIFDRSDFDEIFSPATKRKRPRGRGAKGAGPVHEPPATAPSQSFDFGPEASPVPAVSLRQSRTSGRGVWLSSRKVTLLSVAALVALGLAFVAGLLVGLLLRHAGDEARRAPAEPTLLATRYQPVDSLL
jgi:hypothetical protein